MRVSRYIIIGIWFALAGCVLGAYAFGAPVAVRVPGLEKNRKYTTLLEQEARLRRQEDSVRQVTDDVRNRFRLNPANRQQYGAELLRLEQEMFDIRNRLGALTGRISQIEQEWVVANLNRPSDYGSPPQTDPGPAAKPDSVASDSLRAAAPAARPKRVPASLLANGFFRENLKENDYKALLNAQSREQSVVNYLQIYRRNYHVIRQAAAEYEAAVKASAADSLYERYSSLCALNEKIADSVASIWGYIWENKTYCYTYLFDRLNRSALLASFEQRLQTMRQQEAEKKAYFMQPDVGFYPRRKEFVLDCEIELADMLDLPAAKDSLREAKRNVNPAEFDFKRIVLEKRYFYDYDSVRILPAAKYTSRNPIPEVLVHPKGEVYRIVLGTFVRAQPVSLFRNAYPLSFTVLEDGRHRYFAGGYRTKEEAQGALPMLRRAGFRQPEVAVWTDGVYSNLSEASAVSPTAKPAVKPAASKNSLYRLEITGGGSDLSDPVKTLISTLAPDKDLARVSVPGTDGGPATFMFVIGSFDSRPTAEQIGNAIGNQDKTLKVHVGEIEK